VQGFFIGYLSGVGFHGHGFDRGPHRKHFNANFSATPEWFSASSGNGDTCDRSGHHLLCAEP
jgi:hypothetical protein